MNRHNLATVIRFEVFRTLRKPVFWAVTLGVPVLIVALAGLSAFSSMAAPSSIEETTKATKSFAYTDDSGLVDEAVARKAGGTPTSEPATAQQAVVDGRSSLFIHYPKDPAKGQTLVYAKDLGLINNSAYSGVAQDVLKKSAQARAGSPQVAAVLAGDVSVTTNAYKDGVLSGGVKSFLPPLMFLVLFFLAITMLGNQMLNITVEEKENRVTEMVLTTIRPTTLIVGKVVAVCVVGLVQTLVFALPGLVGAFAATALLPVRDFVQLDPQRMLVGFALFVAGFLLFAGLLICLGSVMPSAKDAGGAYAAVMITLFLPLYAISLVLSQPRGIAATVLTYFPLTAPITAMLRNASGSLSGGEAAVVLLIVLGCAVALLLLGARLFGSGSLAYDQRLKVLSSLRRARG